MADAAPTTAIKAVPKPRDQHLRDMADCIRFLLQQAKSGHPGAPLGMADIATVLFRDFMQFLASTRAAVRQYAALAGRYIVNTRARLDVSGAMLHIHHQPTPFFSETNITYHHVEQSERRQHETNSSCAGHSCEKVSTHRSSRIVATAHPRNNKAPNKSGPYLLCRGTSALHGRSFFRRLFWAACGVSAGAV
jgi:hypothetical protein